jgi:hypothetical protein
MSDQKPQTFANHARYVPPYHFVLFAILFGYLAWAVRHMVKWPTPQHGVDMVMAVGFMLLYWYARAFVTTVQDRVIRLEETLRMERLLPPDLKPRIGELSRGQFVALRFASDAELPGLVRKVLDEKISEQKAIKALVKDWRPDYLRA